MAIDDKINSLIEYYKSALIVQYKNKPKASATIELYIKTLLADGLCFKVINGYNLDNAVGKQLDIIGKYVGVDRKYLGFTLNTGQKYFTFATKQTPTPSDVCTGFNKNGKITATSDFQGGNLLLDNDYRTIIKLKILINNANLSEYDIDSILYIFFGDNITMISPGDMQINYFISESLGAIAKVALQKKMLPKPGGVAIKAVIKTNNFFSLANKKDPLINSYSTGFNQSGKIMSDTDLYHYG